MSTEEEAILREYVRRDEYVPAELYSPGSPSALFLRQGRERSILRLLDRAGMMPLADRRILDVGCGHGQWLIDCETWGARRSNLAGIDLSAQRVETATARLDGPLGADIRLGSAKELPWLDRCFDIVIQSLVLSSIPSIEGRAAVAREMVRVLAPAGLVLSYDIAVRNPQNPRVWAIPVRQLRTLFPACDVEAVRVTLAPPIARRVVPRSWLTAEALERLRVLNTHRLAILRPRSGILARPGTAPLPCAP